MRHASFLGVLCGVESVARSYLKIETVNAVQERNQIHMLLTQYMITRIQNNLPIFFCLCRSFL